jgi:AraC-like DNA-binding protein
MAISPPRQEAKSIRFTTDDFPEKDRAAGFRELYGRHFLRLEVEPLTDKPFYAHLAVRTLPGLAVVSGQSSAFRLGRTKDLIADGDDALTLQIATCAGIASQLGREIAAAPDDAIAFSNADVGSFTFPKDTRVLALRMPRAMFAPLLRHSDAALVRAVPGNSEAVRLLREYMNMLCEGPALNTPELQHLAVAHVYDLAALALGATPEAASIAKGRGVPAARLRAIKEDVMRNLGDATLSAEAVAVRHFVTPRYVRMLFEGDATTFTAFVLRQRLVLAHRMLISPRFADRSISAIAFEAGFSDLSYFNRTFRREFGGTPSDARASFLR